jgi:hypothetical protein
VPDNPPVEEIAAPQAETPPPEPVAQPPEQQVHPWTKRSFGFQYNGAWLEGSSYVVNRLPNGRTQDDASGWYGTLFYESLEQLINSAKFVPEQQAEVLATIQRLVR